jgi:hypothetical protein
LDSEEEEAKSHVKDDQKNIDEKTGRRLNKAEAKKAKDMLDYHRGNMDLSKTIAKAMQEFNITSEAINLAIDTANTAGFKFNLAQAAVSTAIREALDFVMFGIRIFKDRSAVKDYIFSNPDGRNMVKNMIQGFSKGNVNIPGAMLKARTLSDVLSQYEENKVHYKPKSLKDLKKEEGSNLFYRGVKKVKGFFVGVGKAAVNVGKAVAKGAAKAVGKVKDYATNPKYAIYDANDSREAIDIVADCQGYEHTSELIEDIGMNMAQSIVFCASKYNPSEETRIMAIAVMTVMGFKPQEIGNTSPEMVARLFDSFKMAR